jgi:serine-type D-Ala-D-Ala carboxypeptidase/endopeptidase (penicillin-binding protein 4)
MDSKLTETNPVHALDVLAKQIKAAGITTVAGEVLIDDRLFQPSQSTGSGPNTVSPVILNDNVIDLTITPGNEVGAPARVKVRPESSLMTIDFDVVTGPPQSPQLITLNFVNPQIVSVRGSIPKSQKPIVRIVPIENSATFARTLFIEALRRQGIRVLSSLIEHQRSALPERNQVEKLPIVATFESCKLLELIKVTLKVSHNLYASTMPCLIAAKIGKTTLREGLQEQGRLLKELGVETDKICIGGGAGGSPVDAVTPRVTVQLLQKLSQKPIWPAFVECLPSLGVDGTLAETVEQKSPVRGFVKAKTGTLIWTDTMNGRSLLRSKALAGVMKTKCKRELIFALFVNDVILPAGIEASREGKVLGEICEKLYEHY